MHDSDKIGRSTIGELLRKDGRGGIVSQFEEGKVDCCSICLIFILLFTLVFKKVSTILLTITFLIIQERI